MRPTPNRFKPEYLFPWTQDEMPPVGLTLRADDPALRLGWSRWGQWGGSPNVHLFVDDWRIEPVWKNPQRPEVAWYQAVTCPDFTIEANFPLPYARYQLWRSRVVGHFWERMGVKVVPVLQWGHRRYCHAMAEGLYGCQVVAVRAPQVGTEDQWADQARMLLEVIRPRLVLHFGRAFDYAAGGAEVLTLPLAPRAYRRALLTADRAR